MIVVHLSPRLVEAREHHLKTNNWSALAALPRRVLADAQMTNATDRAAWS